MVRRHQQQLRMFHEMYNAWDFRLVLCADVSDGMMEQAIEMLEEIAEMVQLPREPLIVSERRTLRTRSADRNAGFSGQCPVDASAL